MTIEIKSFVVKNRKDFRKWLKKNHLKEKKVAVILNKKHTGIPAPSHRDLMEEAICFGWIDTTIKRLDENQFQRYFARRNSKSKWSDNTLSYAKKLIEQKKMTPIGLQFYREGLSRPTHDHGIPKNPDMPLELEISLNKNMVARENFSNFSPSVKRTFYRWILRGKRKETKMKRVCEIIDISLKKKKLNVSKEVNV